MSPQFELEFEFKFEFEFEFESRFGSELELWLRSGWSSKSR